MTDRFTYTRELLQFPGEPDQVFQQAFLRALALLFEQPMDPIVEAVVAEPEALQSVFYERPDASVEDGLFIFDKEVTDQLLFLFKNQNCTIKKDRYGYLISHKNEDQASGVLNLRAGKNLKAALQELLGKGRLRIGFYGRSSINLKYLPATGGVLIELVGEKQIGGEHIASNIKLTFPNAQVYLEASQHGTIQGAWEDNDGNVWYDYTDGTSHKIGRENRLIDLHRIVARGGALSIGKEVSNAVYYRREIGFVEEGGSSKIEQKQLVDADDFTLAIIDLYRDTKSWKLEGDDFTVTLVVTRKDGSQHQFPLAEYKSLWTLWNNIDQKRPVRVGAITNGFELYFYANRLSLESKVRSEAVPKDLAGNVWASILHPKRTFFETKTKGNEALSYFAHRGIEHSFGILSQEGMVINRLMKGEIGVFFVKKISKYGRVHLNKREVTEGRAYLVYYDAAHGIGYEDYPADVFEGSLNIHSLPSEYLHRVFVIDTSAPYVCPGEEREPEITPDNKTFKKKKEEKKLQKQKPMTKPPMYGYRSGADLKPYKQLSAPSPRRSGSGRSK